MSSKASLFEIRVIDAISDYIRTYATDIASGISMVDLRCYVRDQIGEPISPNTLAKRLRQRGYVREGYRRIETCPGKSLFYVLPAKATTHG
jgi:hypothetical protein